MFKAPYNFYGISPVSFAKSKVAVLPVPYEGTVSYQHGTSLGPQAIITASRQVEFFDIELQKEIPNVGVFTYTELEPSTNSVKETVDRVEAVTRKSLKANKFQIMLGGEHSITPGAVRAFAAKYKDLSILQLDAHSDLRDEYEGSAYNHACAMRRCREMVPTIIQCGIRSQDREEAAYIRKNHLESQVYYGPNVPLEKIVKQLTKHVYVSIDLDVFDPSIMLGTGTPEPGGMLWEQVLSILRAVMKSVTVVGADVVELAPIPGISAPDFLAAKLVHKLIAYKYFHKLLR